MNIAAAIDLHLGGTGSGCHGDKCGRPSTKTQERSDRAKATHTPSTRAVRKVAMASQTQFANSIKGQEVPDNKPFDVLYKKTGIEVKTLVSQTNDKITMHPSSLARKMKEAKSAGLTRVFTVVFDKRPGKSGIYVREGLGSFRLGAMTKVDTMNEVKAIITGGKK